LSSSQTIKQEVEKEGSHCQANPVAPVLHNRWHQFWTVWLFRCEGASSEIPEISLEIPDFPEILEKSPENPGFTDKFVLNGDFSRLAYSPPLNDIMILSRGMITDLFFSPNAKIHCPLFATLRRIGSITCCMLRTYKRYMGASVHFSHETLYSNPR
jgi:hypothetical protein